jgi:hypothetical protein
MVRARVRIRVTFAYDDLVLCEDLEGQQRREAQPVVGGRVYGVSVRVRFVGSWLVSIGLGLVLGIT